MDEWLKNLRALDASLAQIIDRQVTVMTATPAPTEEQKQRWSDAYAALLQARKFIRDALTAASGQDPTDVG